MFGVVLWRDIEDRKAVIWCEDHGDLAFYKGTGEDSILEMDTGDLVQFELREERHLRFASNPRLVAEQQYPALAVGLKSANKAAQQADTIRARSPSKVIAFKGSFRRPDLRCEVPSAG